MKEVFIFFLAYVIIGVGCFMISDKRAEELELSSKTGWTYNPFRQYTPKEFADMVAYCEQVEREQAFKELGDALI